MVSRTSCTGFATPRRGRLAAAQRALQLLSDAGISATANGCRGLDHGAWVPLLRLYPDAKVPVAQVSIQPSLGADHHLRVGAALAPLVSEGVLLIGSGHLTHNLREWITDARRRGSMAIDEREPEQYVREFTAWVDHALRTDDRAALAAWLERAPHARRAHPTPEHFLPLPFAFGAAGAKSEGGTHRRRSRQRRAGDGRVPVLAERRVTAATYAAASSGARTASSARATTPPRRSTEARASSDHNAVTV